MAIKYSKKIQFNVKNHVCFNHKSNNKFVGWKEYQSFNVTLTEVRQSILTYISGIYLF